MEQKCQYLLMELHSGGNVKLTTCDPSHSSFRSCFELVHSRFSVAEVESIGISGLEITEVVRVENRLLFNRFGPIIVLLDYINVVDISVLTARSGP